jgi:ATP-dependent DNA helicase RecG
MISGVPPGTRPPELAGDCLSRPVHTLPGVAARRAALLVKLGLMTWFDLVNWFPRTYEDWSTPVALADLQDGQEQLFMARVVRKPTLQRKGRLSILRTVLRDEQSAIAAVWFNQPYLADRLITGHLYRFFGRIRRNGRQFDVQNPTFEPVAEPDDETQSDQAGGAFRPIYPLTGGLTQGVLRHMIQSALTQLLGQLPEPLPQALRRAHHLCAVDFAYSRIHQPASQAEIEMCRRRLGFEELFLLQAGLYLLRRQRRLEAKAWPLRPDQRVAAGLNTCVAGLPFILTTAQQRVWQEISNDLAADRPMNRLLQGDVGSGKTVLAALAMLQCALCGAQAVLMAPTAILAQQHHQTLTRLLGDCGPIALLTGATTGRLRQTILDDLAGGRTRLLVGTHALIEDTVQFFNLALAITDEQHRFGVRQRIRLSCAGTDRTGEQNEPHVLVMSATPIPRSLALIVYGDLDLSVLDERPAGRIPISTYTASETDRPRIEQLIRRQVQGGRQVYIVCPMIDEQADLDLESAVATYNRLAQSVFSDLQVGLLHGGMRPAQKDQVMAAFMAGTIQILVSTTVIEVGVDNPNATLMVIENAERFGLAQLHQLRGRIGRGAHRSVCILVSDAGDDLARERLKAVCHASDGFALAEKDLELRGPGDFFGTRQHGLPALRLVNLYRDRALLDEVRQALAELTERDPDLLLPEHRMIRRTLTCRYRDVFAHIGL